jgi:hypothetical protein
LSLEALVFAGAAAAADDGAFDVLCFSQAANKNKLTTTAMNLIMGGTPGTITSGADNLFIFGSVLS